MKRIFYFLFFLAVALSSNGEKEGRELIDSLRSRLAVSAEDTGRVRILGKLAFQYYKINTDTGIIYSEQAIALAEKLNWNTGLAFSYNYLGINYGVKGNYPKALECFNKSLLKYTLIGDQLWIAKISNNLANLYNMMKQPDKGILFVNKAIAINTLLKNKKELTNNLNNLGTIYYGMAEYTKSSEVYYRALKLSQETNDKELQNRILINIAENKTKSKDYCTAVELCLNAIKLATSINSTYDVAMNKSYIGEIFVIMLKNGYYTHGSCPYYPADKRQLMLLAKQYLLESEAMLQGINDLELLSEISNHLSYIYEQLGDSKAALSYYKSYSALKDSVFSQSNNDKIADLENRREVEIRDNEIKIQHLEIDKKNVQMVFQLVISVLIFVLVIVSLLYYNRRRQQEKERQINDELRKAKDKAEESDRLKSAFLANISHEIRTPMNGILGFAGLLREPKLSGEEQQEYIRIIENSGTRMLNIINQLVDISRIEAGQMDLNYSDVDVNGQINFLHAFFKPEADKKALKLDLHKGLPDREATINTDGEKLYAKIGRAHV